MKRKRGFTLIEITMAVLILAAITLIAVPVIRTVLNNAHQKAYNVNVNTVEGAAKGYYYTHSSALQEELDINGIIIVTMDQLKQEGFVAESIENPIDDTIMNGYVEVSKSGKSVKYTYFDGIPPATYNFYSVSEGVNKPQLAAGMTPIKRNGSTWVDTIESDPDWYSYTTTDKQWANARTDDCTNPSDLSTCSMWVWVPRYIYKITSGWHDSTIGTIEIQFTKNINDNWNNSAIGDIDTGTTSEASNNTWTSHPAFTFGDRELPGIWIAKFKATAVEGVDSPPTAVCYATDDVTIKTIKIIPNSEIWRCIKNSNSFATSRSMETNDIYGWGTSGNGIDTHLMKNTEWGAVAYLSKSIYGKNTEEIWVNPSDDYTTGCAGDSVSSSATTGCLRSYETENGVKASTTGTIYGIYDISGPVWERVAAYINNGNSSLNSYGSSILSADPKYRDTYSVGAPDTQENNYALAINKKGDAVYETSSAVEGANAWFQDYCYMPNVGVTWFARSGHSGTNAGAYHFYITAGHADMGSGFRPVLLVGSEL